MKEILRVLGGSYAHGLETPESDKDYGIIYITNTSDLLKVIPVHVNKGEAIELPEGDSVMHELGKMLSLAVKSNPTILEYFWLQ